MTLSFAQSHHIDQDLLRLLRARSKHVIVELGMGDGRLLGHLAKQRMKNLSLLYIGIEKDTKQFSCARSRINLDNVRLLKGDFVELLRLFPNFSVDRFLAVLPDPAYIDQCKVCTWHPFYRLAYSKLKEAGSLELITEITNELWQPVQDNEYYEWVKWLKKTFQCLGFSIGSQRENAPREYSSHCLEQFRGGRRRIRIVTLEFRK